LRARNIKPQVFTNELLACADALYTVIFEGLWCYSDREGRCEDRPQRIHLAINPGRAFERTLESLDWLVANGFVRRYQVGKRRYLAVPKFLKHQNPHYKEPPSVIPAPPTIDDEALGFDPDDSGDSPGLDPQPTDDVQASSGAEPEALPPTVGGETRLIPDSGFLIPDSYPPNPLRKGAIALTRGRKKPRDLRDESLRLWLSICDLSDEIVRSTGKTWDHARSQLGNDQAHEAVEKIGGYRAVATRTQFTTGELKRRFREAYEQIVEKQLQAADVA
jgi:hypothetical protein